MPSDPVHNGQIFQDSIICGMMGGAIAWLLGQPFVAWAMLCALTGPVFIMIAQALLLRTKIWLPYKESGIYEFLAFASGVFVSVILYQIFG